MNCQHCQPLLLDHLYGLLDGPEAASVDAHLASCPACAAVRAETARVQGLIARAAKSAFPNTRFEAPAQPTKSGTRTPAPTAKPTVLPFPASPARADGKPTRTLRIGTILPWAIAAGVLLAIPGTVIPVMGIFDRAATAKREAETAQRDAETADSAVAKVRTQRETTLRDAQLRLTVAEQTQTALLNKWVESQKAATQTATARKLAVDVLKPATVQPGAPNDFLVVVRDSRERWETVDKRMVAEVHAVEASDAVIFTQSLDHERKGDTHPLRLPAAAWAKVKPNAELYLVVAQVDTKTGARTELQERVRLAGPVFTTLLVTDKATYRPGERLFFRSLTLDRITFRPPTREQILKYELLHQDGRPVSGLNVTGTTELVRVAGEGLVDPVRAADGQPVRGVGCGEFVLPPDLADGDYTLILREQQHPGGFPATVPLPVTRPIKVRAGAAEQYRKEIGFERSSFAPAETVGAWAELKFQDKPVANAAVTGVAVEADGTPLEGVQATKETDAKGRVQVRFTLPEELLNGDVRLKVTFRTPGGEEAVADRVPVVGNRLKVEFFPECGDTLVAGVPCKVYVRATTPAGQPADIRGIITDGREVLARVESLSDKEQPGANRGLAVFTYTPKLGGRAWLKLESPAGVYAPILPGVPVANVAVALLGGPGATATRTGFPLPQPQADGVVMSVLDPITAPGQPIRVKLHSVGRVRTLVVGAYTRGKLSDTQKVTVEPDLPQTVNLMAGPDPRGGVVRITAFEELDEQQDLKPVAERLVFRKPGEVLKLAFEPTLPGVPAVPAGATVSGSPLSFGITATDEKGNPTAAILWAAVVNSGVAPGAKDRLMPTHFLLAGEVKNPDDLEFADFLLTDHAKAGEALDLLLGTQGWRRFAEQAHPFGAPGAPGAPGAAPQKLQVPNAEMTRLMVQNGQYATWTEPAAVREHRKLFATYAPRYEAAVKAVAQAKTGLEATRANEAQEAQAIAEAASAAETASRTASAKTVKAESAREPVRQFRSGVWYGIGGLAALAFCCGAVSLMRPSGRLPLGFSTLGSVGLAAFLFVAAGWSDDAKAAAPPAPGLELSKADRAEQVAPPAKPGRPDIVPGFAGAPPAPPPPGMPAPPKPGGVEMTADVAKGDGVGLGGAGGGPAKPTGGMGFNGAALKDVRPPFLLHPPGFTARPDPKIAPPSVPGPPAPPPGPGGPPGGVPPFPTPIDPHMRPVPVAPGVAQLAPMVGDKNGVPWSDIVRSADAKIKGARGKAAAAEVSEELKDALKKSADLAAKFANDRATTLAPVLDAYFAAPGKVQAPILLTAESYAMQMRAAAAPIPPLVVREFAAPRPTLVQLADHDTPDTVLWQPVIVLPADGKATLNFHLGSATGGYRVVIAGHTADGRLGATRGLILVAPAPTPASPILPGGPGGSVPPTIPVAPGPQPAPQAPPAPPAP